MEDVCIDFIGIRKLTIDNNFQPIGEKGLNEILSENPSRWKLCISMPYDISYEKRQEIALLAICVMTVKISTVEPT